MVRSWPLDLLLESLNNDRNRFAQILPIADLTAPVPTCPNWDVHELIVHLGRAHRWATAASTTPPGLNPPPFGPRPDRDVNLHAWLQSGLGDLITTLREGDPNRPVWSFLSEGTVAFWIRRQALETFIHRVDTELALGMEPQPVPVAVASCGIDEWCELQASGWFPADSGLNLSVHLHATDGEGEWFITVDSDGFRWEHGHYKGDVAIRGSHLDLLLALWRRGRIGNLEVLGDTNALDQFLNAIGG